MIEAAIDSRGLSSQMGIEPNQMTYFGLFRKIHGLDMCPLPTPPGSTHYHDGGGVRRVRGTSLFVRIAAAAAPTVTLLDSLVTAAIFRG